MLIMIKNNKRSVFLMAAMVILLLVEPTSTSLARTRKRSESNHGAHVWHKTRKWTPEIGLRKRLGNGRNVWVRFGRDVNKKPNKNKDFCLIFFTPSLCMYVY